MGFSESIPASAVDGLNKLKILISGASGSGKSTMGAKFKRPFIIPTELQGIPAMRLANPDAVIFHNENGRPGVQDVQDIAEFMAMLGDPRIEEFDAVVLDSLTDLQEILLKYFDSKYPGEKETLKKWGGFRDKTEGVLRKLRDLPVHALVTCLDVEVDDGGSLVHRPSVYGKSSGFPNKLPKFFNLVGYAHRKPGAEGMIHSVMFAGPERFITKPLPGFDNIEPAEPQEWLRKFSGGEPEEAVLERVTDWHKQRAEK